MLNAFNPHNIWLYAHILLFVYWLGADLGVLLLARAARRSDLSFAERVFALKMAMQIDILPRLCFALMFPVGLQLMHSDGFAVVPVSLIAASWLIALAWIVLIAAMLRSEGSPLATTLNRVHLVLQIAFGLGIALLGLRAWHGSGPLPGGWLAAKVTLFALIFALGIGIDVAFRPVGPAFVRLANEGSQPDIEATISTAVSRAIVVVLTLYALLLLIAWIGVSKPF